jgi:hypothetical protein
MARDSDCRAYEAQGGVRKKKSTSRKGDKQDAWKRAFWSNITVELIGEAICLTFHREADEVEVWVPARCAATAGLALLETAMGPDRAARVLRRVGS